MNKSTAPFRPAASPGVGAPLKEHLPAISVCVLTAMTVVAHLVPFDTAAEQWNNVAGVMLWLVLLLGWALAGVLRGQTPIVFDRTTMLVLVVTLLPGVSAAALALTADGNARLAFNLGWQWASFGILFFLARQWLQNAADARMLAAVMVSIAVGMSVFAVVQFTYLQPQTRAAYEQNPERVLRDLGLDAPKGSPLRRHFEDRLASTEPTGTFALTNSLAGMLTPWLVLLCGLTAYALAVQRSRQAWRYALLALVVTAVLILTKSRTAVLATVCGVALALLYVTPLGRRLDSRILLTLALIGLLAVSLGVVSSALDVEVLSEAPKSVLYRFQYWQSTAAMIRDRPLLGVGPGNFQDTYKHYQLPEASENIADPHNFMFELWAIAGTPAALALLALAVVFASELRRAQRAADEGETPVSKLSTAPFWAHFAAIAAGILLAYGCGFLSEMVPDLMFLLSGVPAGALAFWLLRPWIERGTLTLPMLLAALVALLVNLLAAGGIAFPGVATSVWLLMAMALVVAEQGRGANLPAASRKIAAWACLAVAVAAVGLFHVTVYSPVFRGAAAQSESLLAFHTGNMANAIAQASAAAEHDPVAPKPWLMQADLWQARLLAEGDSPALRTEFDRACDEAIARDPRSHTTRTRIANWRLRLYRHLGQTSDLAAARHDYEAAVARYPNNALAHAQLAWALHLAGDSKEAAVEAERALALDSQHDHSEYKLKQQQVFDPGPAASLQQPAAPEEPSAEPLMQALRKTKS